jgi:HSP20 family molecular chaperone IbpA
MTRQSNTTVPPFDVERTGESEYLISLALADFSSEEVTITAEQSALTAKAGSPARKAATTCTAESACNRFDVSSIWLNTSR